MPRFGSLRVSAKDRCLTRKRNRLSSANDFSPDRSGLRRFFIDAWGKKREGVPPGPLEGRVARIVAEHPEYHALLDTAAAVYSEFNLSEGRTNPFLHMAMHVAIHEQVSANRSQGIQPSYAGLVRRFGDAHALEHAMMKCLGETLWQAEQSEKLPHEQAYVECIRALK